jgi:hypothetical protein
MPSTPTTRLRVEKQALGENAALWGAPKLNAAIDRLEEGIAGFAFITISGATTTLTSVNYSADQARCACLALSGTLTSNSVIIVPNVEKPYLVVNDCTMGSYSLTIKTAAGTGYALRQGPQHVYCQGADVYRGSPRLDQVPAPTASVDFGSQKITGLATPTLSTDGVTKAYVDSVSGQGIVRATGEFQVGATTTTTPGYSPTWGNTLGVSLWGIQGRQFVSQDAFSNWNMTTTGALMAFSYQGANVGGIAITASTTSYGTTSDYRLKQDIEPLAEAVDRLMQLKPSRFAFKADPETRVDGFIAHELAEVVPEAVSGEKDGGTMQSADAAKVVPLLVAAVQQLVRRVELLEDAV